MRSVPVLTGCGACGWLIPAGDYLDACIKCNAPLDWLCDACKLWRPNSERMCGYCAKADRDGRLVDDDGSVVPTRITSDTGGQKDRKLAAFDQIPTDSLWELAEAYGRGALKYSDADGGLANWRRGYPVSLSYAAAMRHLTQAMGGEDVDPENGVKHVISAAWHCFALAHWANNPERYGKFDDRQSTLECDNE